MPELSREPEWDLIAEMAKLVKRHHEANCCTEENCGCPGSQLRELTMKLREEFRPASPQKEGK